MIEKIYKNQYQVICDNCEDGFECTTWAEAQERIKSDGWRRRKFGGEYMLFCGVCIYALEGEKCEKN